MFGCVAQHKVVFRCSNVSLVPDCATKRLSGIQGQQRCTLSYADKQVHLLGQDGKLMLSGKEFRGLIRFRSQTVIPPPHLLNPDGKPMLSGEEFL